MAQIGSRRSLTSHDLEELLDHVADRLLVEPCDTTLRHATGFLMHRGFDVPAVTVWLNRRGGYCDCEVLLNVAGPWWDRP